MIKEKSKDKILEIWVERYSDPLYSWAFYKTQTKETAEDLVQETFLSAFKSYAQCKNKENAKTWLFAILNNKIKDYYRKTAKTWQVNNEIYDLGTTQLVDGMFDQNGSWTIEARKLIDKDESQLLDNKEFNEILEKCLGDLPENWKIAVLSKYIYNKKGKDICQELNISPSNYWQVLYRAKHLLKMCLEKHWKE